MVMSGPDERIVPVARTLARPCMALTLLATRASAAADGPVVAVEPLDPVVPEELQAASPPPSASHGGHGRGLLPSVPRPRPAPTTGVAAAPGRSPSSSARSPCLSGTGRRHTRAAQPGGGRRRRHTRHAGRRPRRGEVGQRQGRPGDGPGACGPARAGRQAVGAAAAGGATWPAAGPTGKWQATWWPGATSRSSGSSVGAPVLGVGAAGAEPAARRRVERARGARRSAPCGPTRGPGRAPGSRPAGPRCRDGRRPGRARRSRPPRPACRGT